MNAAWRAASNNTRGLGVGVGAGVGVGVSVGSGVAEGANVGVGEAGVSPHETLSSAITNASNRLSSFLWGSTWAARLRDDAATPSPAPVR